MTGPASRTARARWIGAWVFAAFGAALAFVGDASAQDASVDGFRSAQFGMSPDQVRAAISDDFGLSGDAIGSGRNTIERTNFLSVLVPDLIEGGGTAQVSYIFGYRSETLIQIGVSWSAETDPAMTDAQLVENGDVLRAFFLTAGYDPETITVDAALDGGIVLFRGSDADGRAVVLILQGAFVSTGDGGDSALVPEALALLYSLSPDDPDVFQIEEGQF